MGLTDNLQMNEQSKPNAAELHTYFQNFSLCPLYAIPPDVVVNYWSQCHMHTTCTCSLLLDLTKVAVHTMGLTAKKRLSCIIDALKHCHPFLCQQEAGGTKY